MTNVQSVIEAIQAATGHEPKRDGSGWQCRCPAHDDKRASLSVSEGEKAVLMHCHAGCTVQEIADALDVKVADLFYHAPAEPPHGNKPKIVKTYGYVNQDGNLVYQVVRFEPKDFRQRRPDPDRSDEWIWSLKGIDRVLYRLPDVLEAVALDRPVYLVEGEKDSDNLVKLGLCATTAAQGAGKWRDEYSKTLRDARVVILPDNDEPGRKHAEQVAAALQGVASEVRVIELPDLPEKGDVSDWLAAGHRRDELQTLVDETRPRCPEGERNSAGVTTWGKKEAPALDWLFEGLVPMGSITGIDAQGGTGKGWLSEELIVSLTIGRALVEPFVPVAPMRVLWIESEDPEAELHRRYRKIAKAFSLTEAEHERVAQNLTVYAGESFPLTKPEGSVLTVTKDYRWLEREVKRLQPRLIVIDPRSHFFGGDENDNVIVGAFMGHMKKLADLVEGGAVVWLNHHTSKQREGDASSAAGRGASSGRDAQRVLFGMVWLKKEELSEYGITNRHLYVRLECTKANWSERIGGPIFLKRETGELGGVLCRVDMSMQRRETQQAVMDGIVHELDSLVGDNPDRLTLSDIWNKASGRSIRESIKAKFGAIATKERIREAFDHAVAQGYLRLDTEADGRGKPRQIPRSTELRAASFVTAGSQK